jgi:anti-anti-sigma factor
MSLKTHVETGVTTAARTARIDLEGRLDTVTAPQLEKTLEPMLDGRYDNLIFDLARLAFISSAGIRVLVHARRVMKAQQGGFLMVNMQPQIVKVFEIIKALPGFTIFESQEELDRYLAAIQRQTRER